MAMLLQMLPRKALKRHLLAIIVWTVFCYGFYRYVGSQHEVRPYEPYINTRQILQDSESTTQRLPLKQLLELQPLVDRSPVLSEVQVLNSVKERVSTLPVDFWLQSTGKQMLLNKTCAKLPNVYDLKFNNLYWQVMESSNGTYNFYSAYYDNRTTLYISPLVRILVMIDRIRPTLKTFCQLWFSDRNAPVIVPVMEYKYVWNEKWGNFKQGILQPYLMACQIPKEFRHKTPQAVTVVENVCQTSTVALRVINNLPANGVKQDFAVCVKGLSFPGEDLSVRLVEWLEMLSILGAKKIFLYELEVHPNISKVLHHYEKQGLVDLTPLTLAGEQPNLSMLQGNYLRKKLTNKRQSELVPYNDCFYRNLHMYEYVVLLDTDEIIMPTGHTDWAALMSTVRAQADAESKRKGTQIASYNTRNVYFFDAPGEHAHYMDIPKYMHMLQHVRRSSNYTKPGHYVKCFHRTDRVIALHNHFPLACLGGCLSYSVNTSDAHLQHYRADCVTSLKKSCEEYKTNAVLDTTIWRYKEDLTARVTRTLVTLGFLPPEGDRLVEYFETGRSARSLPDSGPGELSAESTGAGSSQLTAESTR